MTLIRKPSTHAARLERWYGADIVALLVESFKDFPVPVPVLGAPRGHIYTYRGDFYLPIGGGAGHASLSDAIYEATVGGKLQMLSFTKAGTAGIAGRSNSLWNVGSVPPAGGTGGTAGTGAVRTRTSTGALQQQNAGSGDTLHFVGGTYQGSVGTQILIAYDRLWDMTHTMTVDPQAVDAANRPTRYQASPGPAVADSAAGNFISGEVTTVLPAATPTITFTYVDQNGNAAEAGPALSTIASAAAVNTIPFTAPNWMYPLNSADQGARYITNVDLSAAMASGVCSWFLGHVLAAIPCPTANMPVVINGFNSAFGPARIFDDACIAFIEKAKGATTATNWWGDMVLLSG